MKQEELNQYISYQLKIPYLQLRYFEVDKTLMNLFSESFIRTKKILPLFRINNTINIAMEDPLDSEPINAARENTGLKIEPVIALESEIESAIDLFYGISGFVGVNPSNNEATGYFRLF